MQTDQFSQQQRDNDTNHRTAVVNVQGIIARGKYPDSEIN